MKWFYTQNKQIINLENFDSFWVEQVPNSEFHVFAQEKNGNDWRIGEFDTSAKAEDWLQRIDMHLHANEHNNDNQKEQKDYEDFLKKSEIIDVIAKIENICNELREIMNT